MGYRHNIAVINKDQLEELRNKVFDIDPDDDETNDIKKFWQILSYCKYNFDLGSLYFDDTTEIYDELYKDRKDLIEEDNHYKMFICPQDIFFTLSNIYLEKAKRYFINSIKPFYKQNELEKKVWEKKEMYDFSKKKLTKEQQVKLFEILNSIEKKIYYLELYKFQKNKEKLGTSDLWEHSAFELIHIHRMIDFEKQVVICFAY